MKLSLVNINWKRENGLANKRANIQIDCKIVQRQYKQKEVNNKEIWLTNEFVDLYIQNVKLVKRIG